MKNLKIILTIILTIAVVQGALLGYLRYQVETQNNNIELVADYQGLKDLANQNNYPLDKLLKEVKAIGITSIGLFEQTPADAAANGEIYFASGKAIIANSKRVPYFKSYVDRGLISAEASYFLVSDSDGRKRIIKHLEASFPKGEVKFVGPNIIEIKTEPEELIDLGIGFSAKELSELTDFYIIPRIKNETKYDIAKKINLLGDFDSIIFDGEEILGYPEKISDLSKSLKENKIRYGYVEIIKQFGNSQLKKLMGTDLIRVHGISRDELKKTKKQVAIERFGRAAKERGIRMLYLRPYLNSKLSPKMIAYNLDYFQKIKDKIIAQGFELGKVKYFPEFRLTQTQLLILGLGIIVALVIMLDKFISLRILISLGIVTISGLGIYFYNQDQIVLIQGLALLAAITFPTIAVINSYSKPLPQKNPYLGGTVLVVNVFSETLLGIIILIGLLSDTRFMLGSLAFRGVKPALLIPILLVAAYFFIKGDDQKLDFKKIKERINAYLKIYISLSWIMIFVLVLGVIFVFLARSGNFAIPVIGAEKGLRAYLESTLLVRPRFKEFLIGYPFLLLAGVLFYKNKKEWLWALLAIGTIAPISFFNSFCHVHTPIIISAIRSFNGLIIGVIIGLILSLIVARKL